MPEYLETTVDKFIFRVATDRYYNDEGIWAQAEGNRVREGIAELNEGGQKLARALAEEIAASVDALNAPGQGRNEGGQNA